MSVMDKLAALGEEALDEAAHTALEIQELERKLTQLKERSATLMSSFHLSQDDVLTRAARITQALRDEKNEKAEQEERDETTSRALAAANEGARIAASRKGG